MGEKKQSSLKQPQSKPQSVKIEEDKLELKIFSAENLKSEFMPWGKGERGQQTYLKLQRKGESAFLYAGAGSVMQAEIQKILIKLANDGWSVDGDVQINFDGAPDILSDRLLCRHEITVEIGPALLPMVDPCQGAPLLERLNIIREDLAKSLGFILPGINVRDNMLLNPNAYIIKLREATAAVGELYLERMMAIGSPDDLQKIPGWSVVEPTYKMPAKWIETKDRTSAESYGCMVQGALNVMLTHISNIISVNANKVLGIQETYNLLADLASTHPVLVEEFLEDPKQIRKIRRILCALLKEKVSLADLITIMEVIGENAEDLSDLQQSVSSIRLALASQICWSVVDADGYIRILTLNSELESELKSLVTDALGGPYLRITDEQEQKLVKMSREAVENLELPPVVIVDPVLRPHIYNLLSSNKMDLCVMSSSEIIPEIKVVFTGEIKGTLLTESEKKSAKKKKETSSFWNRKINQERYTDE